MRAETYFSVIGKNKFLILLVVVSVITMFGCQKDETRIKSNKILIDIEDDDLKNQSLYYFVNGDFTSSSNHDSAAILVKENSKIQAEATLYVKTDENHYTYSLGKVDINPFNTGELKAVDIDSDGIDELVFLAEITGNGATLAKVFDVTDDGIKLIDDLNLREDVQFEYAKNKQLLAKNDATDFSVEIDVSKQYANKPVDSDGKFVGNVDILKMPVSSVSVDVAGENSTCVISYSKGIKASSFLGEFTISLQWNESTSAFEICDLNFVPAGSQS